MEGIAWVFGLAEEGNGDVGEVARIDGGGVLGLDRVEWAKGGREVLGFTEHGVSSWTFHAANTAVVLALLLEMRRK